MHTAAHSTHAHQVKDTTPPQCKYASDELIEVEAEGPKTPLGDRFPAKFGLDKVDGVIKRKVDNGDTVELTEDVECDNDSADGFDVQDSADNPHPVTCKVKVSGA